MYTVVQSGTFRDWLGGLRDAHARARINARLRRAELGNLGDVKAVGRGVSEMRVDHGPGYRVYFTQRDRVVIVLLCGGDKRTQASDIKRAQRMASQV